MTFHSPTDLENARKSDKANSKQKYVYLNIWINTHMHVCVCGCAWADVCACVRSCTCMHARVCVHVHLGMRVCVPAFLSSYMWQRMELVYVYVQRINSYIYSFCRRTNPEVTLPNSRRLKDTIVPGARRGSMTPACHALDRPGRWHRPAPSAMGHAPCNSVPRRCQCLLLKLFAESLRGDETTLVDVQWVLRFVYMFVCLFLCL